MHPVLVKVTSPLCETPAVWSYKPPPPQTLDDYHAPSSRVGIRLELYHWMQIAIRHDGASRSQFVQLRGRGHSHPRVLINPQFALTKGDKFTL
jgi:hypothetical protein